MSVGLALGGFMLLLVAVLFPIELSGPEAIGWFYIRLLAPLAMMLAGLFLASQAVRIDRLPGIPLEELAEMDGTGAESISDQYPDRF